MLLRWIAAAAFAGLCVPAIAVAQDVAPPDGYVWADACKDCHPKQYDSWKKTKHATAILRLSAADRASGQCVGCHVTGVRQIAEKEVNANVQCEECHGAGKAHVAAAASGGAAAASIARKPSESSCTACHSDKSPHFKFFSYSALAPLVHQHGK